MSAPEDLFDATGEEGKRFKKPSELAPNEGFRLNVPPVPAWTLERAVALFRVAPETEGLTNVVYDSVAERYVVDVPAQSGRAATVSGEAFFETEDRFVVLQLHSHGRMDPFWSATDDVDEARTGLYGVVGELGGESLPRARFRFSCGGSFRDVFPGDLFGPGWDAVVRWHG